MIKAKKHLGQHFLADKNIARKIAELLPQNSMPVLEIGPGTGVLTKFLIDLHKEKLHVVELDSESVEVLEHDIPELKERIHFGDFLKLPLNELFDDEFMVIGNFPYNISSPILFKIIEHYQQIPVVVGMFQKEVAERVATSHNSKQYGILSVWTQMFYTVKYCFTVHEHVFIPPPKVKSGVILLERNVRDLKGVDPKFLLSVIKTAFNQRRKILRNSLSQLFDKQSLTDPVFDKRPEQLSVDEFIDLACYLREIRSVVK
ncbi:MAG TPA: 16S rRNA (adenine(1518)-N(6)/adenine(1519)-N(6))-dimethyltransferase RsmA [Salinivirgaceae bacterium]|nr:16S rRNA (adenine(1518)-N(6)/adenine(1519)-N(6))-dimethyltransferase RsmA [Salinivirgaceae bacterium]